MTMVTNRPPPDGEPPLELYPWSFTSTKEALHQYTFFRYMYDYFFQLRHNTTAVFFTVIDIICL